MSDSVDLVSVPDVGGRGSHLVEVPVIPTPGAAGPTTQRIYDSNLAVWCWYELVAITPTPAVGDTTPNHTNNLVPATHEIL